jgi:hypothetical protein
MATDPLSQREFDTWRESDEAFKREMRDHILVQTTTNLAVEGRVTSLETHREHAIIGIGIFSSIISTIVGSIAGFIFGR